MDSSVQGMGEVQRRKFLRTAGQGALVLMAAQAPTGKVGVLGSEQLEFAAADLNRLRRVDGKQGASGVAVEATWHAQRLLGQLKATPTADPLRRRLAMLTGEAASLAGHTAHNLGEAGVALAWARVVEVAGGQAGSPDLIGWGLEQQARFLDAGGRHDQALGILQRAPARRAGA